MKGKCKIVECKICNRKMSFGRIKRHIKSQHNLISLKKYLQLYWKSLPLHKPCKVCNINVVYKYKTCSKECRSKLEHGHKGKPKPKGFMSQEHKNKISKSHIGKIVSKETGIKISKSSKGVSRNKGKQPMLGKKQSNYQKQKVRERFLKYYKEGNKPWTVNNKHSFETIEKIFKKRKENKLEKFVSYILEKNNIPYDFQFFLKDKENCKSYDFKIKNKNILLEIDGDYWHGGPSLKKYFYKLEEVKKNDIFKNMFAKKQGFILLRFWESEIYSNPEIIIEKLKPFI